MSEPQLFAGIEMALVMHGSRDLFDGLQPPPGGRVETQGRKAGRKGAGYRPPDLRVPRSALELERAGCFSHLRRYFFDARHHHPNEAALALRTIRDLFVLERSLEGAPLERVREVRQQDARPLVEGLFTWIDQLSTTVRPTSALGEALGYARNQRDTFFVYLDRPELPMHNNLSELLLRGPVVGRKNWMFSGSEGGAEAAAVMFTLIGSCMLQAIDPLVYLTDVLDRLPFHPANRVHELTPLHWRLARARDVTGASPDPA